MESLRGRGQDPSSLLRKESPFEKVVFTANSCDAGHRRGKDCRDWLERKQPQLHADQGGADVAWILKDGEMVPREITTLWEVGCVSRGVKPGLG